MKKNIVIVFILSALILFVGKFIAICIYDISFESISNPLEIKCESDFQSGAHRGTEGVLSRSLKKLCKEIDK
ncbi:hypothetical protein [Serratia marcescens]|uniref:hypothetical protein n=1 Tax=Serratia marcescens TaxID=615 RepID=UPI001376EAC1|nr:hypothetical protein [Serratia marcescens]NCI84520.1 hypothetical protein [Serratia marcescens]NDI95901.1 hypothetical protein [Serratia marcescens]NDJ65018.1 hypothetical protein [Serratia marcescens]HAT3781510.1 hypothetical protein [Serratia marcescens]HAT3850625.1 hypothetical protein [Serratia marcescens]